jgi:AraC family transcriptional activator of mar-sox-rob regulon
MHQENVISQLLAWIEQSLDQPLTVASIAAKSGYSKWHLQRMFKHFTGEMLGTYVRRRRLTAAARELRLTSTTVACIADKYQFDSQQTFTRSFKKQFGVPPAAYRRNLDWPGEGLQPPLLMTSEPTPEVEIIVLSPMKSGGRMQQGSYTQGQMGTRNSRCSSRDYQLSRMA